jgi:hypothetical protein
MIIPEGGRAQLVQIMYPIRDRAFRERVYSSIKTWELNDVQITWILVTPMFHVELKTRDVFDGTQRGRPVDQVQLTEQLVQVFLTFYFKFIFYPICILF